MQNLEANILYMHYMARTAECSFNWGGGGLKTCTGDASLLGGASAGFFGSEMVFSTFSMRYFSAKTQPG